MRLYACLLALASGLDYDFNFAKDGPSIPKTYPEYNGLMLL